MSQARGMKARFQDYDTGRKSFKIYGKHTVWNFSGLHDKREAERVVCECMY